MAQIYWEPQWYGDGDRNAVNTVDGAKPYLEVTVFHLPKTKCAAQGKDVFWSEQHGTTDTKASLTNHLRINSPPKNGHLFAYHHSKGHCLLTK
jgi:hypothetical protein